VDKMHLLNSRLSKNLAGRYAPVACGVGMMLLGGAVASAAVSLPLTGGMGYPDGDSAGFVNDQSNMNEQYITTITSLTDDEQTNIGTAQNPVYYDLKFYITTSIYRNMPTGDIDFVYQVHNVSDDNQNTIYGDSVTRLTLQSFAGYSVTADYIPNTGMSSATNDVLPIEIDRSTPDGSVVGYNFQGYDDTNTFQATTLIPNSYSDYLVVRTDATTYTDGTASVIGGHVGEVQVQVPFGVTSVPEPASAGLLTLVGSALLGRRRRGV